MVLGMLAVTGVNFTISVVTITIFISVFISVFTMAIITLSTTVGTHLLF